MPDKSIGWGIWRAYHIPNFSSFVLLITISIAERRTLRHEHGKVLTGKVRTSRNSGMSPGSNFPLGCFAVTFLFLWGSACENNCCGTGGVLLKNSIKQATIASHIAWGYSAARDVAQIPFLLPHPRCSWLTLRGLVNDFKEGQLVTRSVHFGLIGISAVHLQRWKSTEVKLSDSSLCVSICQSHEFRGLSTTKKPLNSRLHWISNHTLS